MRFGSLAAVGLAVSAIGMADVGTESPVAVHQERYAMGTMFDIVAYHASGTDAQRAVGRAMDEIVRLDRVMSHYKIDSDLSRLNRDARRNAVTVDPSLYDVIVRSLDVSRRSEGAFDVTFAPLLDVWKRARAEGRRPSGAEIDAARTCVGYWHVEASPPNRIRFDADCIKIELGGIGKGYAVERAIEVLRSAGIANALVNAGGSSIAAIGAPPGREGWPVELAGSVSGSRTLLLRNESLSTSQQNPSPTTLESAGTGDIVDPHGGVPVAGTTIVSVVAPGATVADALSTALLILPVDQAAAFLDQFDGVSAVWVSDTGTVTHAYCPSRLRLAHAH